MPIVKYAVWLTARKARTENYIRLIFQYWSDELRIFLGIVLQIGVLDQNNISSSICESRPQCRPLPLVVAMSNNPHTRYIGDMGKHCCSAITRTIVDDNYFFGYSKRFNIAFQNGSKDVFNISFFIIN